MKRVLVATSNPGKIRDLVGAAAAHAVVIETLPAAFEMDEILYELRDHSAGLNCGRWDYIFGFVKKFAEDPASVLPDRGQVTMTTHFLRSYSLLLIKTCHRREIHAMGGMAAQIPIRDDPAANEAAMEKVRADKLREALALHPASTTAELAEISGLSRATITKQLITLKSTGDATAIEGDLRIRGAIGESAFAGHNAGRAPRETQGPDLSGPSVRTPAPPCRAPSSGRKSARSLIQQSSPSKRCGPGSRSTVTSGHRSRVPE